MSRRTWERHRNKARDASVSAAIFISSEEGLATARPTERAFGTKEKKIRGLPSSQTATTSAADRYVTAHSSLPLELRLLALGMANGGGR